nr:hypothetical protein [Polymorphobacter sp.]
MFDVEWMVFISFAAVVCAALVGYAHYLLASGRREHRADLDQTSADLATILHSMKPPQE